MWLLWILPLAASFLLPATGELVNSFNSCNQFFLRGKHPNLQLNNVIVICQHYNNKYHFVTMYDKYRRIPIFSAYKLYNRTSGQRRDTWKIEPQLAVLNNSGTSMELENRCGINPNLLATSQAVSSDYANAPSFDRGHLTPVCHQLDQESKNATFTLTNTVPLCRKLNRGQWKAYEQRIKKGISSCDSTYAILGVIPGNTTPFNNRVNIPSHIWAAICCVDQNQPKTSWAFIAENNNQNEVDNTTLTNLENYLSVKYGISEINLFNGAC